MSNNKAEWEKGRYISLFGDPIGRDGKPEKLRTSFYKAADFKAAGIAVALGTAFAAATGSSPEIAAAGIAFSNLFSIGFLRGVGERLILGFSKDETETKCIDTQPDDKTVPTLDRYGLPAKSTKLWYGAFMVIYGASDAHRLSGSLLLNEYVGDTARVASKYTRVINGYNRFNRVAKGDWVIVDMPKPKPVEEKTPIFNDLLASLQA